MAAKKPKRDPNIPVLVFKLGITTYEILIAGSKEYITCAHNPKRNWSDNSLIVRRYDYGLEEIEYDLHDASTWGWFGRLMANPEGEIGKIKLLTPTDKEKSVKAHVITEKDGAWSHEQQEWLNRHNDTVVQGYVTTDPELGTCFRPHGVPILFTDGEYQLDKAPEPARATG